WHLATGAIIFSDRWAHPFLLPTPRRTRLRCIAAPCTTRTMRETRMTNGIDDAASRARHGLRDGGRRTWLRGASLLAMLPLAGAARASAYPQRQLSMVVPFVPGGPVDIAGRALSEPLARHLGQTVTVVSEAGDGANARAAELARSPPDEDTLLLALVSILTVHPYFYGQRPGKCAPALSPVGMVGELSSVLVVNDR